MRYSIVTLLAAMLGVTFASAHKGEVHPPSHSDATQKKTQGRFNAIDEEYRQVIRPIFQKSCFDCHSNETRLPWYYAIPGIRQFIDEDVKEAKKHLEFGEGFPFQGHGSPDEDLEAIEQVVSEETMPPWRYRILHWESKLSDEEKQKIVQWVHRSRELLKDQLSTK